jgi:hypothetical protein
LATLFVPNDTHFFHVLLRKTASKRVIPLKTIFHISFQYTRTTWLLQALYFKIPERTPEKAQFFLTPR